MCVRVAPHRQLAGVGAASCRGTRGPSPPPLRRNPQKLSGTARASPRPVEALPSPEAQGQRRSLRSTLHVVLREGHKLHSKTATSQNRDPKFPIFHFATSHLSGFYSGSAFCHQSQPLNCSKRFCITWQRCEAKKSCNRISYELDYDVSVGTALSTPAACLHFNHRNNVVALAGN